MTFSVLFLLLNHLASKLKKEEKDQVSVALFTVGSLKKEFKNKNRIILNAQQRYLTGALVMTDERNIVLVEGSAKNIRFYKRLLLHRLKWGDQGV